MKKILIFDAYPSIRRLLAEELKAGGNLTVGVGKPEEVGKWVETFKPDLIVLDLYTRGRILWELLEELKSRFPAIPVVLFTAFHPAEVPRFREADAWVPKSFRFEELKRKVGALLAQEKREVAIEEPILAEDSTQTGLPEPLRNPALPPAH